MKEIKKNGYTYLGKVELNKSKQNFFFYKTITRLTNLQQTITK